MDKQCESNNIHWRKGYHSAASDQNSNANPYSHPSYVLPGEVETHSRNNQCNNAGSNTYNSHHLDTQHLNATLPTPYSPASSHCGYGNYENHIPISNPGGFGSGISNISQFLDIPDHPVQYPDHDIPRSSPHASPHASLRSSPRPSPCPSPCSSPHPCESEDTVSLFEQLHIYSRFDDHQDCHHTSFPAILLENTGTMFCTNFSGLSPFEIDSNREDYIRGISLPPSGIRKYKAYVFTNPRHGHLVAQEDLPLEWLMFKGKDGRTFYQNWTSGDVKHNRRDIDTFLHTAEHIKVDFAGNKWPLYLTKRHCELMQCRTPNEHSSNRVNSAFTRATYWSGSHWRITKMESRRTRDNLSEVPQYGNIFGIYVFPRMPKIRRRALIIACTYTGGILSHSTQCGGDVQSEPKVWTPSPLHGTLKDARNIIRALVRKGWNTRDIVVLSERHLQTAATGDREDDMRLWNSEAFHACSASSLTNAITWLNGLVAGLEDCPENVSSSLFLYFAGHGVQKSEFGEGQHIPTGHAAVASEDDRMDEYIMLSDCKIEYRNKDCNGRLQEHVHGMLMDNDINEIVCERVVNSPNTQLIVCYDSCNSGTGCDLPFTLHRNGFWYTTGEARRDEIDSKVFPAPWECGVGVVWAIAACCDNQLAFEDGSVLHDVPPGRTSSNSTGGMLTTALCRALNGKENGKLTFAELFNDISHAVAEAGRSSGTAQTPMLCSSHACNPKTYMYI